MKKKYVQKYFVLKSLLIFRMSRVLLILIMFPSFCMGYEQEVKRLVSKVQKNDVQKTKMIISGKQKLILLTPDAAVISVEKLDTLETVTNSGRQKCSEVSFRKDSQKFLVNETVADTDVKLNGNDNIFSILKDKSSENQKKSKAEKFKSDILSTDNDVRISEQRNNSPWFKIAPSRLESPQISKSRKDENSLRKRSVTAVDQLREFPNKRNSTNVDSENENATENISSVDSKESGETNNSIPSLGNTKNIDSEILKHMKPNPNLNINIEVLHEEAVTEPKNLWDEEAMNVDTDFWNVEPNTQKINLWNLQNWPETSGIFSQDPLLLEPNKTDSIFTIPSSYGSVFDLKNEGDIMGFTDEESGETNWDITHFNGGQETDVISVQESSGEENVLFDNTNSLTSEWSTWSSCSITCGQGVQERHKLCGSQCEETESRQCWKNSCENGNGSLTANGNPGFSKQWDSTLELNTENTALTENNTLNYEEEDLCEMWVSCKNDFLKQYLLSLQNLPSCPCYYPTKIFYDNKIWDNNLEKYMRWQDASGEAERLDVYKKGAYSCIRSLVSDRNTGLAAQHCCYDKFQRLITRGPGAGTPHLISPEISRGLHYQVDILPWVICKGDWTRFNQVRLPNNKKNCFENPDDFEFDKLAKAVKVY